MAKVLLESEIGYYTVIMENSSLVVLKQFVVRLAFEVTLNQPLKAPITTQNLNKISRQYKIDNNDNNNNRSNSASNSKV